MADEIVRSRFEAETAGYERAVQQAAKATDKLADSADKAGKSTKTMGENAGKGAEQASTRMGRLSAAVTKHSGDMQSAGSALVGVGTVLTATTVGMAKAAMDWESAWAGVTKTVDGSPEQMAALEGELRNLATTLPATHTEIAGVAEAAGQLGVAREDVTAFTKTMIDLSETTNLTADQAATSIAQFMNVMGTAGDDVDNLGAALVALGNDGASTEAEIMDMAQRLSGAGQLIGATESDVLALANALASVGVEAQLGGGSLSRIMQRMYTDVQTGGEGLEALAEVAGVSAQEFAAAFENDPVRAVAMLTSGLNGVKESGGNVVETMSDLGIKGTEETSVMLRLAGAGDLLTESLDLGAQAWEENTALVAEATKRYETTEAKISIAWNNIKDAAIDAGAGILPVVATVAEGAAGIAQAFAALPDPVKGALGSLSGIGGIVALAAGGFLTLAPRVAETVTAMQNLNKAAPGAHGFLKGLGKAGLIGAGVAALGSALIEVGNASQPAAAGIEEVVNQLLKFQETQDIGSIDDLFDFSGIGPGAQEISGLAAALDSLDPSDPAEHIASFGASVMGFRNIPGQAAEAITTLDQAMATMDSKRAADDMNALRQEMEAAGRTDLSSWSSLKELFPEYTAGILRAAEATGQSTTEADLFQAAMGNLPPHMRDIGDAGAEAATGAELFERAAAGSTEAAEDLADAVQGALDGLREMGIAPRNAQAANDAYEASLDSLTQSLKDNGATLSDNTDKGRANRQALRDHADAGLENAAAMGELGASQGEISGALMDTYNSLVDSAVGFGLSKTEAELYAKELLELPTNVDVDVQSEMDREALEIAGLTGAAIAEIPGGINVLSEMDDKAAQQAFKTAESIKTIPGYKRVDVAVDDQGTPGQIQSRINALTGATEYVFVTDNGTVTVTQQKITGIDGKTEYVYVTDDGTVVATQGSINNIQGKSVTVDANAETAAAEAELNHTARNRHMRIIASVTGGGGMSSSSSLLRPGLEHGGIARLPRYEGGGQLPYTGLGVDKILGVTDAGMPIARVNDGEFIEPEPMTRKYRGVLEGIRVDHPSVRHLAGYAGGGAVGREWSGASMSAPMAAPAVKVPEIDYNRLASAVATQLPGALDGMKVVMNARETIGALRRDRAWKGS
jgi:TP901 family phage tail tape measure protein